MRINPSDILFLVLSVLVLLVAALVLGGLAAQPFPAQAGHPSPTTSSSRSLAPGQPLRA